MEPEQQWLNDPAKYQVFVEGLRLLHWQIRLLDRLGVNIETIDALSRSFWILERLGRQSPLRKTMYRLVADLVDKDFKNLPIPPETITRDRRWAQSTQDINALQAKMVVIKISCNQALEKIVAIVPPDTTEIQQAHNAYVNGLTRFGEWIRAVCPSPLNY